ncbi:MAG: adenylosuccinate lyase [Candidatus Diapherotrites archaeon]|uniref:Adenylosuccinate lyase n=1 Tax=Candidatus Iainarchaeum sp. TaxID=3101447 RepID=A0A2D6LNV3_9ARCH|nr:adenylosuccinate lyase [Candidatus Diapherotrites archaeon]
MDKFDLFSPLDYRYISGPLKKRAELYFSENARVYYQARVEAALVKALSKQGVCSKKIAKEVERVAEKIKAEDVYKEEARIKHDVRALANVMRSKVSKEAKPYIHFSSTSYDIVDTSSAVRYKEAVNELVLPELKRLLKLWCKIALREKKTIQIGRTHGQHAEPITFGFTMAGFVNRLGKSIANMEYCSEQLEGKFSGAVGAFNASSLLVKNPTKLEKDIMLELNLKPAMHSTQIVPPESLLDLLHSTIEAFNVLANFSDDMRHLQRSEISEIAEGFGAKQVGSSTMPHKRNPINFENVKSLWKQFMPRIITFYSDSISEHQRDLTNSASARFIPELFLALLTSNERLHKVCSNLVVDRKSMKKNFDSAKEKVIAEPLYILLAKHEHPDAHELVRKLTLKGQASDISVWDLAKVNKDLAEYINKFSKKELSFLETPEEYVGLSVKKTEEVCSYWKKRFK